MAHKKDSIPNFDCQLTKLAGFDELLSKSHTKTDGDDARADDLTRQRYDNVQKRNLSKKPPSVLADVRPSGSAGDSATARLWIFLFRLFAVRVCACLGERSEPTCIKTSTRQGAKDSKTDTKFADNIDYFANLCYNIIKKIQKLS